nr:hypothetical protein [Tanacetum cinerariifolium]
MSENHSKDRVVKEVLMMELMMHTEKNDIVVHTEKTGMVILVVKIDVGVKEVLMMELMMHTEKNDIVVHTEKTGMVILMVKIDVGGMTADGVDKLTCSSDDVQPKQVDVRRKSVQELRVYLKLFQLHIVDIHIV